jgi:HEPN superfamily AbiU2-like protein
MIKVKDSTEFSRLLGALSRDIVDAHIHYRLYKDLRQSYLDHRQVAAQSNTFWSLTLRAHLHASLQMLYRAYDQETKSLHLHNWLLTIKEHLHLFGEEEFRRRLKDNPFVDSLAQSPRKPDHAVLEEDILLCSPDDPQVKTLVIHRNSRIAHKGARNIIAERDINDDHPLTFGDVDTLLDRAKTILNRYSSLFAANSYSTQIVGHDDYQYIFKCVDEKIQRIEEKIEENRRARRKRRDQT